MPLCKLIAVALVLTSFTAWGEGVPNGEKSPVDVTFKFGTTSGVVTQLPSNIEGAETAGAEIAGYAGNPFILSLNYDVDQKMTLGVEAAIVGDFVNKIVAEKGVYGTVAYHLMGGARRTKQDLGFVRFIRENPYNFSLMARVGYTIFDVAGAESTVRISGSTFETMVGIQFRQNVGENSAIAFEFLTNMIVMPATAPQVTCKRTAILLSYRFFL